MQFLIVNYSVLIVLFEVLIAFLSVIAYVLYRFTRGVMYRLWSASWILFSVASTLVLFTTSAVELSIIDAVASGGIMVSSLLLFDGTHEKSRHYRKDVLLYPTVFAVGFVLVPIGIIFNLSYGMVFTPGALLMSYSCFYSVNQFRKMNATRDIDYWTLIFGLIVWGSTMVFFPLNIFIDVLALQLIFTTTGLLMAGAGMLNVFIRETTENLKMQYSITRLISGIINHDIRNYVGVLQESIEQMKVESPDHEFWLGLTSDAIESMAKFIEEIRQISAGMSRFEAERTPFCIIDLMQEVRTRVDKEYTLSPDAISITVDEDVAVLTNSLVKEMFWNIFDNAFKHGCKNLRIQEKSLLDEVVVLEIIDDAGGLPANVAEFLNDPDSLSTSAAPGMGLGLILIKGLSVLCGVNLKVENETLNDQPVGAIFTLGFKRHIPV
jgi:signal transduction histidine kinase